MYLEAFSLSSDVDWKLLDSTIAKCDSAVLFPQLQALAAHLVAMITMAIGIRLFSMLVVPNTFR